MTSKIYKSKRPFLYFGYLLDSSHSLPVTLLMCIKYTSSYCYLRLLSYCCNTAFIIFEVFLSDEENKIVLSAQVR